MSNPIAARCDRCGTHVAVMPPNLPSSGGVLNVQEDPENGWQVLEFVCGACWDRRPRTWTCIHCGGTGPISGNFCSQCHRVRPDPLPHVPDWDLLWKEEGERQRQHEALIAEWDREHPGWRTTGMRRREPL